MIRLAIAHFLDELVIDVPIILFAEEFRHLAFLSLAPWDGIVCILSRATSEQRRRKKKVRVSMRCTTMHNMEAPQSRRRDGQ